MSLVPKAPPDCDPNACPVPHARETLESYSRLHRVETDVVAPGNLAELCALFAHARTTGRRLTFRCGGHIFDDQSMNDDLVVTMRRFDRIEVDVGKRQLTVGAGATWGAILDRLEPLGLVPYITVTTRHASAGGTLSGDCLSRFSPSYGKEGVHVVSFELMTPMGEIVQCVPPRGAEPKTLGERLFLGVIGGLGYLGAVTQITYRLLYVGQTDGRIGVESTVHKFRRFDDLVAELVPRARRMHLQAHGLGGRVLDEAPHGEALYSALFEDRGKQYGILVHSRYTTTRDRRPLLLHVPDHPVRPPVEWMMRAPLLNRAMWHVYFDVLKEGERFVDDVAGYTFFMDGNLHAKLLGRELVGAKMATLQQTFVIPATVDPFDTEWDAESAARVNTFLRLATARLSKESLVPTLFDVLFLPRDAGFHLSASTESAGFAVTFAFETSAPGRLSHIERVFEDLADACHSKLGGRVYLVKNVRARSGTIQAMYEDGLAPFFALKREVDPGFVLRNAFLERHFAGWMKP